MFASGVIRGGGSAIRKNPGGGPVIDLGVHVIDLIRYITGKPRALSVSASTFDSLGSLPHIKGQGGDRSADYDPSKQLNNVEDGACAIIRFDNGMTLTFETSWTMFTRGNNNYLNLFGDKGGAQMEPELELYGVEDDYFTNTKPGVLPASDSFDKIFQREIDHFVDCVRGKCECRCPAEDGLEVMKILDAVYESGKTKKEVII
jgi:predicted dehydrogenase